MPRKAQGKKMKYERFDLLRHEIEESNPVQKIEEEPEEKYIEPPKLEPSQFGGEKIVANVSKPNKNLFPLPDNFVGGIVCGSAGSGKSYLMLSLIDRFKNLSQIIVCSKIEGNPVYSAIEQYCAYKNIEYGFASDVKNASGLIETFINNKNNGKWTLIIFDDFNNGSSRNVDDKYNKIVIMSYQMLRNYQTNILFITQSYTGAPTLIRNNMSFLVLFKMMSKPAVDRAMLDAEAMTGIDKDDIRAIYDEVIREEHGYLMVTNGKIYTSMPSQGTELIRHN